MHRVLAIALKDLRSVLKERTFLMAVALQLFVAMFASVLTFGLLVLYNPTYADIRETANVGLVGDAPVLESVLKAVKYDSIQKAMEDFKAGKIEAIVWLPKENLSSTNFVRIYLPKEEITSIKASVFLKNRFIEYEKRMRELRGIPGDSGLKIYSTSFKKEDVPEGASIPFKLIYVALIPLLMLTTAATVAGMYIDLITEEVESKTSYVLLASPLTPLELITSKMLAAMILSAALTPTWIVLLILNHVEVHNYLLVVVISLVTCAIFISIASIATLAGDREKAQLVFSLAVIAIIPLFFSSPLTPVGLVTRIAAGSPFEMYAVAACIASLSMLYPAALISQKLFRS